MLVAARRGSQAASQQAASQHEEAMRALVEQAMKGKEQQRQLASWRRYIRKRRQAVAAADATLAGARSLIDVLAQHVRASVGDELLSLAAARVAGSSSREPEPEPEEASGYWSRSGRVEIDGEPRQLQLRGEVLQIYAAPSGALLDIVRLVDVTEFTRTDSNSRRVVRLESRDAAQSFVASVSSAQEAAEWESAIQHNKAALERTAAARLAASRDRRKCIELEGSAAMEAAAATISERIEDHRVSRAEELSSVARARDAVIDAVLEQQVLTSAHRGNQQASDKEEDRTLDTLLLCAGTSLSAAFSQSDEAALSRQLRRCRGCSQEFIGVATRLQQQPQAQQQPWAEAVRELRRLADADTPTAMLSVVTDTIRAIYRTVNDQTEASKCSATSSAAAKSTQTKSASVAQATATATGAPSPAVVAASVGADELMPIVIYVLIKAQVDGLGARLNFVEKLCNQTIIFSEAGYYFNTLAAALSFLQRLEPPCETDPPSALEPEQEAAWGAVGLKIPQRPAAASVKVGGGSDTCEDDDDGSASSKLPSHHSRTTETELCPLEAADQEEEDDEDEQQAAAHDNSCSSGQRHSGRRGGSKMSAGGGGSSQQQVAQLAAVSRAHVWKRAKLRFGSVAGASPPCSPTPPRFTAVAPVPTTTTARSAAAAAAPAAVGMVGLLDIQPGGTGDFVTVYAELVGDELRFEVFDIAGCTFMQAACVTGARVGSPKHKRKGRPGTGKAAVRKFIVDAGADAAGGSTGGCGTAAAAAAAAAAEPAELIDAWKVALQHHASGGGGTVAGAAGHGHLTNGGGEGG